MSPTVSVIVPAYNAEPYVEAAVRSALRQTVTDIEVLVVDDCSIDATRSRVTEIDDPRVHLHTMSRRSGPGACRNHAIEHSAGEWIATLDADDWWGRHRLEALLQIARVADADMICDDLWLLREGDTEPYPTYCEYLIARDRLAPFSEPRQISLDDMVSYDYGYLKPLVRAAFLGTSGVRYRENVRIGEDFAFAVDCLVAGARMFLVPDAYYYYRQTATSLTRDPTFKIAERYRLLTELLESARNAGPSQSRPLHRMRRQVASQMRVQQVQDALAERRYGYAAAVFVKTPRIYRLAPGSILWRLRGKPPLPVPGLLANWLSQQPVKSALPRQAADPAGQQTAPGRRS
jgi:succinoglycan biosynthesis protein ExoO